MLLRVLPSSAAIVSVIMVAFALLTAGRVSTAHDSCCSSSGEPSGEPLSALFLSKASEACPWLLIGLLTTAALEHAKFPVDLIRSLLVAKQRSAPGGTVPTSHISSVAVTCLLAALAGLATPLCSCGALPLAMSLSAAGAPPHAVVAFLTAAQSAGLDSAAITLGLLGPRVAAFRLLGSVVLAVAAGAAAGTTTPTSTARHQVPRPGHEMPRTAVGDEATAKANHEASLASSACCDKDSRNCKGDLSCGASAPGKTTSAARLITGPLQFCRSLAVLFDEVWVMLAAGILVTALVESSWAAGHGAPLPFGLLPPPHSHAHAPNAASLRPEAWDEEEDGPWEAATEADPTSGLVISQADDWHSDLLLRAGVIVAALPLQLCEHGVVSFASALHKAGVSPGTAQAFLLSAPATNITTLGVLLQRAGGAGSALRSAIAIAAAALLLSYAADHWSAELGSNAIGAPPEGLAPPRWFAAASVPVCVALLAGSLCHRGAKLLQLVLGVVARTPTQLEAADKED